MISASRSMEEERCRRCKTDAGKLVDWMLKDKDFYGPYANCIAIERWPYWEPRP